MWEEARKMGSHTNYPQQVGLGLNLRLWLQERAAGPLQGTGAVPARGLPVGAQEQNPSHTHNMGLSRDPAATTATQPSATGHFVLDSSISGLFN